MLHFSCSIVHRKRTALWPHLGLLRQHRSPDRGQRRVCHQLRNELLLALHSVVHNQCLVAEDDPPDNVWGTRLPQVAARHAMHGLDWCASLTSTGFRVAPGGWRVHRGAPGPGPPGRCQWPAARLAAPPPPPLPRPPLGQSRTTRHHPPPRPLPAEPAVAVCTCQCAVSCARHGGGRVVGSASERHNHGLFGACAVQVQEKCTCACRESGLAKTSVGTGGGVCLPLFLRFLPAASRQQPARWVIKADHTSEDAGTTGPSAVSAPMALQGVTGCVSPMSLMLPAHWLVNRPTRPSASNSCPVFCASILRNTVLRSSTSAMARCACDIMYGLVSAGNGQISKLKHQLRTGLRHIIAGSSELM